MQKNDSDCMDKNILNILENVCFCFMKERKKKKGLEQHEG